MLTTPCCIVSNVDHLTGRICKKIVELWNFCEVLSQFLERKMKILNRQALKRYDDEHSVFFRCKFQAYMSGVLRTKYSNCSCCIIDWLLVHCFQLKEM